MAKFFLRWIINAVALYVAVAVLTGNGITPLSNNPLSYIWLALIFGLLNAFLKPLLNVLTCLFNILTLGLFTLVINTLLFALTAWAGKFVGLTMTIADPFWWNAFLGALIVSAVSFVLSLVLHDELKGRHHKKD